MARGWRGEGLLRGRGEVGVVGVGVEVRVEARNGVGNKFII